MNEEKMMILKMLEEGKIDSAEAIKLIDAIASDENNSSDKSSKREHIIDSKKVADTLETVGSTISDTVLNLVEGIKNIDFSSVISGNYETADVNLTKDISSINKAIIDLSSTNGYIRVTPVESDNLMIKVNCKYKAEKISNIDELYNFYIKDNTIKFEPTAKAKNNTVLNLNVLLPNKKYEEIKLYSTNGDLEIDDLDTNLLKLNTTNGQIDTASMTAVETTIRSTNGNLKIENINGTKLDALTSNGRIEIVNANEKFIYAKTTNSGIKADNIRTNNFMAKTTNGRIETTNIDCNILELHTTNGSISSILSDINRDGKYDLSTSFGSISLDKDDLIYDIKDLDKSGSKKILAKDSNYDNSNNKIEINITTTHGSISLL